MKLKLSLAGFIIMIAGVVICATLTAIAYVGAPLIFIGAFLFCGAYDGAHFIDYCTYENGNYVISLRKRHYYHFLPITILLMMFGVDIKFIYRVEYFKYVTPSMDFKNIDLSNSKIKKSEYKMLLNYQKQQYLHQTVQKEIIHNFCADEAAGIKAIKTRFIIPLVITLLSLTMLTQPDYSAIILTAIYAIPLGWLTILRYTEYKEAKFKKSVYDKYFQG